MVVLVVTQMQLPATLPLRDWQLRVSVRPFGGSGVAWASLADATSSVGDSQTFFVRVDITIPLLANKALSDRWRAWLWPTSGHTDGSMSTGVPFAVTWYGLELSLAVSFITRICGLWSRLDVALPNRKQCAGRVARTEAAWDEFQLAANRLLAATTRHVSTFVWAQRNRLHDLSLQAVVWVPELTLGLSGLGAVAALLCGYRRCNRGCATTPLPGPAQHDIVLLSNGGDWVAGVFHKHGMIDS